MSFNGFSQKTLDFLFENRLKNSKSWFEEHRKDYEDDVLAPLRELVIEMTPTMLKIDPLFTVAPAVNKTISRIHRDIRFSHDKSIYRDEMWFTFMRNKKFWQGLPGYYFIFGAWGFSCGVGYYEASKESLEAFRGMVLAREASFKKAYDTYKGQDLFVLRGDRYKKTKFPDQPEHIREWLDLKNIDFEYTTNDYDLLFSPALTKFLSEGFITLKPIYEFICRIEERKKLK